LVDDLYKDDEIFKHQYVDIADADDDVMITGVNVKLILELNFLSILFLI